MQMTERKINEVAKVNFIVKHPEFVSYGFTTKESVLVEGTLTDFFRLFVQDNGTLEIYTANHADYDIVFDAAQFFNAAAIKAICEAADPLPDLTKDYIAFYETQGEEW